MPLTSFMALKSLSRRPLLLAAVFLASCASLPDNTNREASYALEDTDSTTLGVSVDTRRASVNPEPDYSGMILLPDGVDAMVARLVLATLAEKSLDVQYYLYHSDLSGKLLTTTLYHAAERGVRVRLLLDDMDMAGKDHDLAVLNAHENIQIRIFNPFIRGKSRTGQFFTRLGDVTRRAHNKAFIADNQVGIIGGRNIGDEYFDANPNMAFGDLDVAISKPAVKEISTEFDLYWNSHLAYPVERLVEKEVNDEELQKVADMFEEFEIAHQDNEYVHRLKNSGIIDRAKNGQTQYHFGDVDIIYDAPEKISESREKTKYHLGPQLVPHLEAVDQELMVISPYFVPGKAGVAFFADMEARGVDVKIVTNSLMSNDVPIVHSGYSRYRKKLLEAGVELYEVDSKILKKGFERDKTSETRGGVKGSKASLHAKYFVMDREAAFIGSLNLDPRSFTENTEIGAVIQSKDLSRVLAEGFDENILKIAFELKLKDGDLVWHKHTDDGIETFTKEPHSSWWDRFSVGFMRILPVESQL